MYVKNLIKKYKDSVNNALTELYKQSSVNAEILNGLIFNNTISDSPWLKYKSFSPGGWAADYRLLYTIYRVLNGIRPQSILEFGLGQSSKLIHQYANFYNVEAETWEHDDKWISFFNTGRDGQYYMNIRKSVLETITVKGYETLVYKGINEDLKGRQFDLVVVDGPYGQENYSRYQIVDIAKSNLKDNFCIIIDDTERKGEEETVKELIDVLGNIRGKGFCYTQYHSSKKHTLICSDNYKFLTSL